MVVNLVRLKLYLNFTKFIKRGNVPALFTLRSHLSLLCHHNKNVMKSSRVFITNRSCYYCATIFLLSTFYTTKESVKLLVNWIVSDCCHRKIHQLLSTRERPPTNLRICKSFSSHSSMAEEIS